MEVKCQISTEVGALTTNWYLRMWGLSPVCFASQILRDLNLDWSEGIQDTRRTEEEEGEKPHLCVHRWGDRTFSHTVAFF